MNKSFRVLFTDKTEGGRQGSKNNMRYKSRRGKLGMLQVFRCESSGWKRRRKDFKRGGAMSGRGSPGCRKEAKGGEGAK